ncbi:2Fe-2S iron-sulfur cluster-binding protein [Paraburkholderia sp. BR14374]|uniref:PDR/VanB family oxidoreductase n=1 Tax=Paraburkholderia sp. BR14374 TaxID=3237007 RepID=UPI0034CDA27F
MDKKSLNVRIARCATEATDIVGLEFIPTDGDTLPPFTAGAHIDIAIRPDLVRQYSLCNAPSETHRYHIAVLRDPNSRGGSVAVHEELREGQTVQISYPRNHFELGDHKHTLLFAGGIGVTPIMCMAEELHRRGSSFTMHYGARSSDRAAFVDRLHASPFSENVEFHFDNGPDEQKLNLTAILRGASRDTHLYVCGPSGFIEAVKSEAAAAGWSTDRVHFEYFGAPAVDTSNDGSFEVRLARSGKAIRVEADQSIVHALACNGVKVETSCEQGVCGTCLTRVLEGEIEHRDHYLLDEEKLANNQMMICCSRSKTPLLVLDM